MKLADMFIQPLKSACALSFFIICACSARPKLLPNDALLNTDRAVVDSDVDYCMELADSYSGNRSKWRSGIGNTAKAATIGTAAGAVGGAIVHSAGKGAAVGAAGAAVASILNELYSIGEPDPTYKRFVEFCLTKKGYQVGGW